MKFLEYEITRVKGNATQINKIKKIESVKNWDGAG
jgi:hypothetical protein